MCPARLLDFLALSRRGGLKKIPPRAVWGWYISLNLSPIGVGKESRENEGRGRKGKRQ